MSNNDARKLFEGKRGPSVEGMPREIREAMKEAEADETKDVSDELGTKYRKDAAYRQKLGPSIELYGLWGGPEFLHDLQIDLDLGHFGSVWGIVRGCRDDKEGLEIEWRCGPNYDENSSFTSRHTDEGGPDELAWYYQGRDDAPDWTDDSRVEQAALDFINQLKSAPKGAKLVDWQRPWAAEEESDTDLLRGINDDDRWYMTLHRLNDPKMAHHYGNPRDWDYIPSYPTAAVLAVYAIAYPTHLPTLVTKQNEELFIVSDDMCRRVSGTTGYGTGWGNLAAFEHIVKGILKDYPPEEAKKSDQIWKGGYLKARGLMLVLSRGFEEAMWDYNMVDDLERLERLVTDFLRVFVAYMSPVAAPSDEAKEALKKDLDFNRKHLEAGVFVGDAEDYDQELFESFQTCLGKEDEGSD